MSAVDVLRARLDEVERSNDRCRRADAALTLQWDRGGRVGPLDVEILALLGAGLLRARKLRRRLAIEVGVETASRLSLAKRIRRSRRRASGSGWRMSWGAETL